MKVLYVNAMDYGENAGVDAIAHGLAHGLAQDGIEIGVIYADFRNDNWRDLQSEAVERGVEAGVDGIVVYVLDPNNPAQAVANAREEGIPVFTLERPRFDVDGCVVYPNFNHGVFMAEYLATLVKPKARVAVIGGPDVVDDIELILGLLHGLENEGLEVINDPFDPRYKNVSDVASGGYEKATNVLADFDDIDALIPYNDETMHGAQRALDEAGLLGSVVTVSRNGTPAAVEKVKAGTHAGTWDLDCPGIGMTVAELVRRQLVEGEKLEGLCVASPIGRMITPENAGRWVTWEERIPYDPLPVGV